MPASNTASKSIRRKSELAKIANPILPPVAGLDEGISAPVNLLRACGVETYESCEGGAGHSYPEPAVRFHGTLAAGWKALAVCIDYGIPVYALRRIWIIGRGLEPEGPTWEIVLSRRVY